MDQQTGVFETLDSTEAIPDCDLDWVWPALDTFSDDSIAPRISHTCSELGSRRIRLIRILPGCLDDAIECETRVCFLAEAGEYTALSYAWGSTVPRHSIIVDGQPRRIATNLWRFLRQARQLPQRFSGWLWVDALSIHQDDPWEKLEQVSIISKTFTRAKKVVVWLGPAYGDSNKAMSRLVTAARDPSGKLSRALYAPPLGPALLGLCERTYWQRLWVFQELKIPRAIDLMCGDRRVDLEHLKRFLFTENMDGRVVIRDKDRLRQSFAAEMVKLTREDLDTSLRSMLRATRHLRCTNVRDKVYAILSTTTSGNQDIEADYTITLSSLLNKILRNMTLVSVEDVAEQCAWLAEVFMTDVISIYGFDTVHNGRYIDPLKTLTKLGRRILFSDTSENIVRDVHGWCKKHDHREIGALVQERLEDARSSSIHYWEEKIKNATGGRSPGFVPWANTTEQKNLERLVRLFDDLVVGPRRELPTFSASSDHS